MVIDKKIFAEITLRKNEKVFLQHVAVVTK